MFGYIYETTNLINGKKYIGQKKAENFLGNKYLGSGILILRAINKYGKENFQVKFIEECNSKEELNKREIYWINYYNAVENNNYYNKSIGGTCVMTNRKHSEETKRKISNSEKGKIVSDSSKLKMKKSHLGIKLSKEHKQNILKGHKGTSWNKGIKMSDEIKHKMSLAKQGKESNFKGKHHTEETKKKISANSKGRKISEETRKKISNSLKGVKKSEQAKQNMRLAKSHKIEK